VNLPFGPIRLDVLFSLRPGKLEPSLLLGKLGIRLLYLEQAFHNFWLGHLQVTVSGTLGITMWIDAQRVRQPRRFACSFASLHQ